MDIMHELSAARRLRAKANTLRKEKEDSLLAEAENLRQSKAAGTMGECGCCFDDQPLNRMVHCDSDLDIHWFCRACALRNAETQLGASRYELLCMSMDGCKAGFDKYERYLGDLDLLA